MTKKKKILSPVLFMIVLTAIYTLALASINTASADRIEEQAQLNNQKSILYTLDVTYDNEEALQSIFDQSIESHTYNGMPYYTYQEDKALKAYVFEFSGKGLWGTITGYIALDPSLDKIIGVDFISHSETPGLGGRIDEDWFKSQFRDLPASQTPPLVFKPADSGNIDAISGATLTSNSVRDMLNDFIVTIQDAKEGGQLHE